MKNVAKKFLIVFFLIGMLVLVITKSYGLTAFATTIEPVAVSPGDAEPKNNTKLGANASLDAPYVLKSSSLTNETNPKLSGTIDNSLVIKNVRMVSGNLVFSGTAKPNSRIFLYVFSSDPTVISLKVDSSGSWTYELNKELPDGEHEIFIAINDELGKIVSKGEPVAFIKTAQAATVIPVSQLKENQSPMEKSSSSYVMMAIAIVVVFLIASLLLIGYITRKRNFNETIN